MNPTIKDVAKRANVSIATVSRVLNNLGGYTDKTRQRVNEVIKEIGYQPNAIARGLINKRTQTIGVLFPSVSSSFSSDILQGVEDFAHGRNYSIVVCNTDDDGKRTMKYLQLLREKQVDGIIFSSSELKDEYREAIGNMKIPVVLISSQSNDSAIPYVKIDDSLAAYDAVDYLVAKGHRKIAMISGGKDDILTGSPRVQGYLRALQKHGIPFDERYLVYGDFRFESGSREFENLLRTVPDLTAVFAASDEMAIGVLSAAYKHGLTVPGDISVIGLDGLPLSSMVVPPLTTVRQPLVEMGQMASEILIQMIETGQAATGTIVPHSIVERQTVRTLA
ncbi:LacI family DNA-binding transcriptional regulator [Paenibacillus rhizophilus]|uniref:LacI family transcriptional regulator n=1 Tax=Paenibacillus rhizophilus TaxID=1850366 RepID=A0A3N9P8E9_9BACL|nr:substrate-binding domain-containing protein [Paenibacillus rhizophilus]RQW11915.1 LacI family transcriptional regulator [Paenibacillus rhizophilus]